MFCFAHSVNSCFHCLEFKKVSEDQTKWCNKSAYQWWSSFQLSAWKPVPLVIKTVCWNFNMLRTTSSDISTIVARHLVWYMTMISIGRGVAKVKSLYHFAVLILDSVLGGAHMCAGRGGKFDAFLKFFCILGVFLGGNLGFWGVGGIPPGDSWKKHWSLCSYHFVHILRAGVCATRNG